MTDKRKPSVAIIVPGGIGTGKNNAGIPILELTVKALAVKFDVTVFSLHEVNVDYRADGFELLEIRAIHPIPIFFQLWRKFSLEHKKKDFVCIHGHWTLFPGLFAVILGFIYRIKSVVTVPGGDAASIPSINYGQLRRRVPRALVRWTLREASDVITLTNYSLDVLRSVGLYRKMYVVPYGVDPRLFQFRSRTIQVERKLQFLHIANLSAVKDQATLLKAFAIIRKSIQGQLTIVGQGPLEANLRQLASELEIAEHVKFVNPVTYSEVNQYYHACDILLHTSLSEGQALVVTEAMYCGLLVCGTAVGLVYDLQHCCVHAAVGDYEGLAQATIDAIRHPDRVQDFIREAHVWSAAHTLSWTVDQISNIYLSKIG
jgi:glycosyltransferase involved in cell wall biosynthesis